MNQTEKLHQFLIKNQDIFWHFDKSKLDSLSLDVIVEYILNYGDDQSVKELFDIVGLNLVAEIFKKNSSNTRRVNYFPEVLNFFRIYFQRHALRNS